MNRDDSGLLREIMREGLLTESQGRRVARAIHHGASLEEALGRTPLIDPLDYHKVVRGATGGAPNAAGSSAKALPLPGSDAFKGMEMVATYDLAEHEEIPMVIRLYELLGEAFYGGMGGLEIGRHEMQTGWVCVYDNKGTCLEERSIEAKQAEKMLARLRVMSRLLPSSKEAQKSLIGLKGNGLAGGMLVESRGDVVRLCFDKRVAG